MKRSKLITGLTLMCLSALGGAYAMYCIMETNRIEKSKEHKKESFYDEDDLEMLDEDILNEEE